MCAESPCVMYQHLCENYQDKPEDDTSLGRTIVFLKHCVMMIVYQLVGGGQYCRQV